MKRNIFLLALLCFLISNYTIAQSPRFRLLNNATGALGAPQNMPTNAVARCIHKNRIQHINTRFHASQQVSFRHPLIQLYD